MTDLEGYDSIFGKPSPSSATSREEPGKAGEWMTIETAPKDGELILLYESDEWEDDGIMYIAFWDDNENAWCEGEEVLIQDFTHWMPLPLPPAQQVKS